MRYRGRAWVSAVVGAMHGALAFARSAAADCVSVQAGRAVVRVNCDEGTSVVAGHIGGNSVTIRDDDPHPFTPLYHPPPIAKHPASIAKPIKPAKPVDREPTDTTDRPERPDRNTDPGDGDADRDQGRNAEPDVSVKLDCDADPETTTVTNNGTQPLTVEEIDPSGGPTIERDDVLDPGDSISYKSGADVQGRLAIGDELYDDDDSEAGVRVSTSGGNFDALCFAS